MSSKIRFFVIRADPCPQCSGAGHVEHPLLQIYQKLDNRKRAELCERHSVLPADLERPQPCSNCAGTGEIRSETTLEAALAELERDRVRAAA